MDTFFCNTNCPWQEDDVENTNGRLRRYLPRKTDLRLMPSDEILQVFQTYNYTALRCLGYLTPAEVYSYQVLHLKFEPTIPLLGGRSRA